MELGFELTAFLILLMLGDHKCALQLTSSLYSCPSILSKRQMCERR